MADCVTSLGGIELEPRALGRRLLLLVQRRSAWARLPASRRSRSRRGRWSGSARARRRCRSASTSSELARYWIERPAVYHHTTPNIQYYALYEGLRLALEEGLEARWARHAEAGAHLQQGMRDRGYRAAGRAGAAAGRSCRPCGCPRASTARRCRCRLLREHAIEVGGGLGPDAPDIWRDRHDGHNAHAETADRLLEAFDAVLAPTTRSVARRAAPDGGARPPAPQRAGGAGLEHSRAREGADAGRRRRVPRSRGRRRPRRQGTGARERDRRAERGGLVGLLPSPCGSTGWTPTGATATSSRSSSGRARTSTRS